MDIDDEQVEQELTSEEEEPIHDDDVESVGESDEAEPELESGDETDTDDEEEEGEGHVTDDQDPDDISEEMVDEEGDEDEDDAAEGEEEDEISSSDEEEEATAAGGSTQIPPSGGVAKPKRKRKSRPNPRRWLAEVKQMQASTAYMIQRSPFRRLVREVAQDFMTDLSFTEESFNAIQTASEEYIAQMFSMANRQAIHRGRITIEPRDIQMVLGQARDFRW